MVSLYNSPCLFQSTVMDWHQASQFSTTGADSWSRQLQTIGWLVCSTASRQQYSLEVEFGQWVLCLTQMLQKEMSSLNLSIVPILPHPEYGDLGRKQTFWKCLFPCFVFLSFILYLLQYSWLTTLYFFQVYNIVFLYFYSSILLVVDKAYGIV